MKNITSHSFTFLIALLCITFLSITSQAQNTSPVYVVEFNKIQNGIMDEGKLQKNQLTDYDDNPVCLVKVKSQGFDEATLQKLVFVPRNVMIMHKAYENGEYRLYVSSRKPGSILIKYQGEYEFKLPYNLEPKKIYELILGMETATLNIITTPDNAVIYIDNEKVGAGFASKSVSIGAEHKYKVECEDYITEENTITFTQSERKEIEVELRPNFGYITIGSTPSGAEVYVDERKVGVTPYQGKKIKRGQHMVEVRLAGYKSKVEMISVKAGDFNTQLQDVVLEAVKVATGTIVLESNPSGAVITIDGRQYGQTPKTLTEFPAGTYTVYFTKEGYQNLAQNLDLKDGGRETLSVTMSKTTAQQQVVQQPVPMGGNNTQPSGSNGQNKTFTVNGVSFEMVAVKGGTFTMGGTSEQGSDAFGSEKPTHSVTLGDYYIGKFEVTQELWEAVMGSNPSYFKGSKLPVESVSWYDCQEFITKLNSLTGANFRLPTEAEWEYAARGGNKSRGYKYSGSNSIGDVAWYAYNSWSKTHAVGTKSPNELGIYDMSGNVREWCQDWYGSYGSGSQTNPQGPSSGSYRVNRGGCWVINARRCRVSHHNYGTPGRRFTDVGLRLVQ